MKRHINIIAALHMGFSIFYILLAGVLFFVLKFADCIVNEQEVSFILSNIAGFVSGLIVFFNLPSLIGGIALFYRKEWGRILTMIAAAIKALNIPVGTALAVYSFIVLTDKEVIAEFSKKE